MKQLPFFILVIFFTQSAFAQNLLSNGNFEKDTACPNDLYQVKYLVGWWTSNSPDYYNTCAGTNAIAGVPTNKFGVQAPASGNGYIGLYTYAGSASYKEHVLSGIPTLYPGAKYAVSMSVSLSDTSGWATNDLGILFGTPSPAPGVPTPQINYDKYGPITNKTGWERLIDTFIATAAHTSIMVGGFKDASNITMQQTLPGQGYAYYYIDSVVIELLSKLHFYYDDTALCVGDSLIIPYNVIPNTFNTGNVFSLQLSDSNGNFSNGITLATITSTVSGVFRTIVPYSLPTGFGYKLRIVSSNPSMIASTYEKEIGIGSVMPEKPVADGDSVVCSNDTLHLTASTTTPNVNWYWVGPNSWWSQEQNPTVIHPAPVGPGFYYVSAYIWGCERRDTVPVAAVRAPYKPIASVVGSPCEKDTVRFYATYAIGGTTFTWEGPNSFTASATSVAIPNGTLQMNGDYIVTAHLNGCTEKDTTTVTVKSIPSLTAKNNGPLCPGGQLNLTVTGTPGTGYSWTGPGSYTSNLAFPSRTNVQTSWSGKYIVKGDLNGCSNRDTTDVVIYPVPDTPKASGNSPVCAGGDIVLSATYIQGASYEWGGPGVWGAISQNATRTNVALNDAGKYYVRVKVNGCYSAADTVHVAVNIGPGVLIYANPGDSICPDWKAGFVAVPKNAGSTPTFEWYKNGTYTGGTGYNYQSPNAITGDSFYVRMTAGTSCNTPITSNSIEITVLPVHTPPTINVVASPGAHIWPYVPVTFKATPGNAGNNPGYQWVRNGVDIPLAYKDEYTAYDLKTGDTICCKVTSNFLCARPRVVMSNCIVMNIDVGVDEISVEQSPLSIYPNPNNGSFNIQLNAEIGETIDIKVFDPLGKLVYKETNTARQKVYTGKIEMQPKATGIYYIRITAGTENYSGKVMIR